MKPTTPTISQYEPAPQPESASLRTCIIGRGRVGTHLHQALQRRGIESQLVNSRNINALPPADLYIIAVSDDAIAEVAGAMGKVDAPVVHTSGTRPLADLASHSHRGVLYPLQSFSERRTPDFSRITFCLEASDDATLAAMQKCVAALGATSRLLDSEGRARLHFAAVVASNFSNHLWAMATQIMGCEDALSLLAPLLEETLAKAKQLGAAEAQTGPAVRGDVHTLMAQQQSADKLAFPMAGDIYRTLTQSIIALHQSKKDFLQ